MYLIFSLLASSMLARAWPTPQTPHGALYFLNNDPSGASVVAMTVNDGCAGGEVVMTSTGGMGALGTDGDGPLAEDALGSQGSVRVYDNLLFTINAGSNTVSMFSINPANPLELSLIGSPAPTGGDFPISVDYSPALQKACVLNGGSNAGVTCFHADPWKGLTQTTAIRMLPKNIINETTPANGPFGSAGQISFNPQGTAVVVTIKGVPGKYNGYILVYPVGHKGHIHDIPIVSQFDNIVLPFAFQFLDINRIFLTDPAFGVAILDVQDDFTLNQTKHTPVPGQAAICWTAVDPEMRTVYAVDAGTTSLWTLDYDLVEQAPINFTEPNGAKGLFDSVVVDNIFYGLTHASGIMSINLTSREPLEFTNLSSVAPRNQLTGMAYFGY